MRTLLDRGWTTAIAVAVVCLAAPAGAQRQDETFESRTEQIEAERRDKRARLWPERQSPIAEAVIDAVERGLIDGFVHGKGSNGPQFILGGMRSGQGMTLGLGYRRSDIWHDRIGYRVTARGTFQWASLVDVELDFPQLRAEDTYLRLYSKYENSPQMDFYGQGADSDEEDRTSYRLEDISADVEAGYELFNRFAIGGTAGLLSVHTGPGKRSGVPSTDEIFDPDDTPGLRDDTWFARFSLGAKLDYRDNRRGASAGGLYGVRYSKYFDQEAMRYDFSQTEVELQQFIPYFNGTRVIALRVATVFSSHDGDQGVPFYRQPVLGGNDYLRGFARQRFHADNAILLTAEHRWYAFDGLEPAIFFEAGKVEEFKRDLDFSDLELSGGIGLRVRVKEAVVMRIDFAFSREGARFMWTFSDIFRLK